MSVAEKVLKYFSFFWIFILSVSTLQYLNFQTDAGFLKLKQFAVSTGWYLPAFYCHVFGSGLILLAGFFQFSKKVYRHKKLHRFLGKLYVFGVLFFASPGAYVMTFFIHRGRGVFLSFMIQNTLWVIFTLSAWILIKKRDIKAHVHMMKRSYALAFAAVTLRFYIWLFTVFGSGVSFKHNYLIIAFLSWVPNLILAELINYREKIKRTNNPSVILKQS